MDSLQAVIQAAADSSGAWRRGSTIIAQLRAANTEAPCRTSGSGQALDAGGARRL